MALRDNAQHAHTDEVSAYVGDFILSITQAMRTQLMSAIVGLEQVPLTRERLEPIQKRPGVYQLFLDGVSVYVGKAVKDLNGRLSKHLTKLSGRVDPDSQDDIALIDRFTFRCMYINADIDALGPEKMLIQQFTAAGQAPWNNSGFGSNDPGRERETTAVKHAHFDRMFPINLDVTVTLRERSRAKKPVPINDLAEALYVLKAECPFLFRYGQTDDNKVTLESIDVSGEQIAGTSKTVREWLNWVADMLPAGWSIVALPGYIIAYEETTVTQYVSRTQVWHTHGASHTFELHDPLFVSGKVKDEDEG